MISREQYYIDLLKPDYNICLRAGSCLGSVVKNNTRLKLRNIWLHRLFTKSEGSTLKEFTINFISMKLKESEVKINKLYKEFDKIKLLRKKVIRYNTRIYINSTTIPSQIVLVMDTFNNIITTFPSMSKAALAINVSHNTIGSRLKGKTTKLCKNRYIVKGINNK